MKNKLCLKQYLHCIDDITLSKTRKKMNKKSHVGRHYGGMSSSGDGGGVGESASLISELLGQVSPGSFTLRRQSAEEDEEITKFDRSVPVVLTLFTQGKNRQEIINMLIQRVGVTEETANSYYERIHRQYGLGKNSEKGQEEPSMTAASTENPTDDVGPVDAEEPSNTAQVNTELQLDDEIENTNDGSDPDKQGVIRTVPNAHLVYKRQSKEGTFEELWIYNVDKNMKDELTVRRNILAGTDIGPNRTRSEDGSQTYTLTTLGNAQILNIKGLVQ